MSRVPDEAMRVRVAIDQNLATLRDATAHWDRDLFGVAIAKSEAITNSDSQSTTKRVMAGFTLLGAQMALESWLVGKGEGEVEGEGDDDGNGQ